MMEKAGQQERKKIDPQKTQQYVWAFVLSAVLTLLAFIAVGTNAIADTRTLILFIILLAIIQVVFQVFYWMHLKDKGHQFPILFYVSFFAAGLIVIFGMILWLGR